MSSKPAIRSFTPEVSRELANFKRTIREEVLSILAELPKSQSTPTLPPTRWAKISKSPDVDFPLANKTVLYEVEPVNFVVRTLDSAEDSDALNPYIQLPGAFDLYLDEYEAKQRFYAFMYMPCGILPKGTEVLLTWIGNAYMITPLCRIAEARVTVGCTAATMAGTGTSRRITTKTFKAELYEPEIEATGDNTGNRKTPSKLKPSGVVVDVTHRLTKAMPVGAEVTVQLKPDGSWCLVVWSC